MLSQIWVVSALCASALAAPTVNMAAVTVPAEMEVLSEYFTLLASKVSAGRSMADAPVCDLSLASIPIASPTPLPTPSTGLTLKHVAIGRGTQNYTCGATETAAPAAIGAVATLYNASCIAATYPDVLATLPNVALQFNLTSADEQTLTPTSLSISGHHYFTSLTTPFFNLDTAAMSLGEAPCAKNNSVAAPSGATLGQANLGYGSVAWLKLITQTGATGNLQEVYRVNTAGGSPPATCAGIASTSFEVQYAAEYWFYES